MKEQKSNTSSISSTSSEKCASCHIQDVHGVHYGVRCCRTCSERFRKLNRDEKYPCTKKTSIPRPDGQPGCLHCLLKHFDEVGFKKGDTQLMKSEHTKTTTDPKSSKNINPKHGRTSRDASLAHCTKTEKMKTATIEVQKSKSRTKIKRDQINVKQHQTATSVGRVVKMSNSSGAKPDEVTDSFFEKTSNGDQLRKTRIIRGTSAKYRNKSMAASHESNVSETNSKTLEFGKSCSVSTLDSALKETSSGKCAVRKTQLVRTSSSEPERLTDEVSTKVDESKVELNEDDASTSKATNNESNSCISTEPIFSDKTKTRSRRKRTRKSQEAVETKCESSRADAEFCETVRTLSSEPERITNKLNSEFPIEPLVERTFVEISDRESKTSEDVSTRGDKSKLDVNEDDASTSKVTNNESNSCILTEPIFRNKTDIRSRRKRKRTLSSQEVVEMKCESNRADAEFCNTVKTKMLCASTTENVSFVLKKKTTKCEAKINRIVHLRNSNDKSSRKEAGSIEKDHNLEEFGEINSTAILQQNYTECSNFLNNSNSELSKEANVESFKLSDKTDNGKREAKSSNSTTLQISKTGLRSSKTLASGKSVVRSSKEMVNESFGITNSEIGGEDNFVGGSIAAGDVTEIESISKVKKKKGSRINRIEFKKPQNIVAEKVNKKTSFKKTLVHDPVTTGDSESEELKDKISCITSSGNTTETSKTANMKEMNSSVSLVLRERRKSANKHLFEEQANKVSSISDSERSDHSRKSESSDCSKASCHLPSPAPQTRRRRLGMPHELQKVASRNKDILVEDLVIKEVDDLVASETVVSTIESESQVEKLPKKKRPYHRRSSGSEQASDVSAAESLKHVKEDVHVYLSMEDVESTEEINPKKYSLREKQAKATTTCSCCGLEKECKIFSEVECCKNCKRIYQNVRRWRKIGECSRDDSCTTQVDGLVSCRVCLLLHMMHVGLPPIEHFLPFLSQYEIGIKEPTAKLNTEVENLEAEQFLEGQALETDKHFFEDVNTELNQELQFLKDEEIFDKLDLLEDKSDFKEQEEPAENLDFLTDENDRKSENSASANMTDWDDLVAALGETAFKEPIEEADFEIEFQPSQCQFEKQESAADETLFEDETSVLEKEKSLPATGTGGRRRRRDCAVCSRFAADCIYCGVECCEFCKRKFVKLSRKRKISCENNEMCHKKIRGLSACRGCCLKHMIAIGLQPKKQKILDTDTTKRKSSQAISCLPISSSGFGSITDQQSSARSDSSVELFKLPQETRNYFMTRSLSNERDFPLSGFTTPLTAYSNSEEGFVEVVTEQSRSSGFHNAFLMEAMEFCSAPDLSSVSRFLSSLDIEEEFRKINAASDSEETPSSNSSVVEISIVKPIFECFLSKQERQSVPLAHETSCLQHMEQISSREIIKLAEELEKKPEETLSRSISNENQKKVRQEHCAFRRSPNPAETIQLAFRSTSFKSRNKHETLMTAADSTGFFEKGETLLVDSESKIEFDFQELLQSENLEDANEAKGSVSVEDFIDENKTSLDAEAPKKGIGVQLSSEGDGIMPSKNDHRHSKRSSCRGCSKKLDQSSMAGMTLQSEKDILGEKTDTSILPSIGNYSGKIISRKLQTFSSPTEKIPTRKEQSLTELKKIQTASFGTEDVTSKKRRKQRILSEADDVYAEHLVPNIIEKPTESESLFDKSKRVTSKKKLIHVKRMAENTEERILSPVRKLSPKTCEDNVNKQANKKISKNKSPKKNLRDLEGFSISFSTNTENREEIGKKRTIVSSNAVENIQGKLRAKKLKSEWHFLSKDPKGAAESADSTVSKCGLRMSKRKQPEEIEGEDQLSQNEIKSSKIKIQVTNDRQDGKLEKKRSVSQEKKTGISLPENEFSEFSTETNLENIDEEDVKSSTKETEDQSRDGSPTLLLACLDDVLDYEPDIQDSTVESKPLDSLFSDSDSDSDTGSYRKKMFLRQPLSNNENTILENENRVEQICDTTTLAEGDSNSSMAQSHSSSLNSALIPKNDETKEREDRANEKEKANGQSTAPVPEPKPLVMKEQPVVQPVDEEDTPDNASMTSGSTENNCKDLPRGFCFRFLKTGICTWNNCYYKHEKPSGSQSARTESKESFPELKFDDFEKMCKNGVLNKAVDYLEKIPKHSNLSLKKNLLMTFMKSVIDLNQLNMLKSVYTFVEQHLLYNQAFLSDLVSLCRNVQDGAQEFLVQIIRFSESHHAVLTSSAVGVILQIFSNGDYSLWKLVCILHYVVVSCRYPTPKVLLDRVLADVHRQPSQGHKIFRILSNIPEDVWLNLDQDSLSRLLDILQSDPKLTKEAMILEKRLASMRIDAMINNPAQWVKSSIEGGRWSEVASQFCGYETNQRNNSILKEMHEVLNLQGCKSGEYFSQLAYAVTEDSRFNSNPRNYQRLGQMGTALLLESHYEKQFLTAYEVLQTMHKYNLDYYRLQKNSTTQNADNPQMNMISPCRAALVAVDTCLEVNDFLSAFAIFECFDWIQPSSQFLADVSYEDTLWRARLLKSLAENLLKTDCLDEGIVVLKRLFATISEDLTDRNLKVTPQILEVDALYGSFMRVIVREGRVDSALEILEYFKKMDVMLYLSDNLLRSLLILCKASDKEQEAKRIFSWFCRMGMYSVSKPSPQSHVLHIKSDLSADEIVLHLLSFFQDLYKVIFQQTKAKFEDRFALSFSINASSACDEEDWDLLNNISPSIASARERIIFAVQNCVVPPLKVLEHNIPDKVTICPNSVYQYFVQNKKKYQHLVNVVGPTPSSPIKATSSAKTNVQPQNINIKKKEKKLFTNPQQVNAQETSVFQQQAALLPKYIDVLSQLQSFLPRIAGPQNQFRPRPPVHSQSPHFAPRFPGQQQAPFFQRPTRPPTQAKGFSYNVNTVPHRTPAPATVTSLEGTNISFSASLPVNCTRKSPLLGSKPVRTENFVRPPVVANPSPSGVNRTMKQPLLKMQGSVESEVFKKVAGFLKTRLLQKQCDNVEGRARHLALEFLKSRPQLTVLDKSDLKHLHDFSVIKII